MNFLKCSRGQAPLILSIPHAGTQIPDALRPRLTSLWLARKDADWWLPELYAFARTLDVTILQTEISRTVIDVNRDPTGASLYPGQATTGLCPLTSFDGEPLYVAGMTPDDPEIQRRRAEYFTPYHAALTAEIARLRRLHPVVMLYDCHSIRSEIATLFDGVLPNFNIGTNGGQACDAAITERVAAICAADPKFSHVVNGRFKGGYITRHYGAPAAGVNALQMELACRGYMQEPQNPGPDNWPGPMISSAPVLPVLKTIIESLLP
jgi:N-formylglutamate deformylase